MLKPRLLAIFVRGRQDLQDLAASLPPEQRGLAGAEDNWSIKDIVAHLAYWQAVMVRDLAGVPREPIQDEDVDRINGEVFRERRGWPWDRVYQAVLDTSAELLGGLGALTEDELAATDRLPWQEGRPLWRVILGNGYTHNLSHLTNWYARNGQVERGLALMAEGMALVRELDAAPEWQGTCNYNLACQYALSGNHERALASLAEALRLNPGLTEWSRQDTDLAGLHGSPAYEALYTSPPGA